MMTNHPFTSRMKIAKILLIFILLLISISSFRSTAEAQYSWAKVSNLNAFFEFPNTYTEKYEVSWIGQTKKSDINDKTVINGIGSLVLKNKINGYETGKIPCEFDNGILISDININEISWYKYVDDQYSEIEIQLNGDDEFFRGSVNFSDDKLIVESLCELS